MPEETTKDLTQNINNNFNDPYESLKLSGWNNISGEDVFKGESIITQQRFEDYQDYIPGKIDPVYGNIDETRARNQSGWGLLGKAIAQGVTEATMGAVEGVGYVLDFEELFNADAQAQEGFDNWFSKGVREAKESIQEGLFPIYQTQQAQEGTLWERMHDGTFWASQGKTIGTTLSLLVPSLGVANAVGKFGKIIRLGDTAGEILRGASAAMFSRKAESAMEANQAFQQEYSKYINEVNPNTGTNYTDEEAKQLAGQSAATVFKANAAMLPLDMLQYSLALKSFKGLKSGLDAVKGTKAGKIVENFIVQPASEALEEGYQFVAQQEATKQVRDGITPFGDGFGKRLSEYIEDPEFQTSAFLGAAMGGLFGAISPISRKVATVNDDFIAKKLAASYLGDIEAFNKIDNKIRGNIIVKNLVSDRLDSVKEKLNNIEDSLQDSEKYTPEEKKELADKLQTFKEDIDYVQKADESLKNSDPKYTENHKLRKQYALLKWEDKLNNQTINELESQKSKLLGELTDNKDNAVYYHRIVESLKNEVNDIKKNKNIPSDIKEKIIADYNSEIVSAQEELEGLVNSITEKSPNFKVTEYSSPNIEELQKVNSKLQQAESHKNTTLRPQMAYIERMSNQEATQEEAKIEERTKENITKLVKETEKADKLEEKKAIEDETRSITTVLDEIKTEDEITALEQQVISSTNLTDKNKQEVLKKTQLKKARLQEEKAAEEIKLAKKLDFDKKVDTPLGTESTEFGDETSETTKQQSQTAESRESQENEPTRQTPGIIKEAIGAESDVVPSTKKTQITNIAHKDIVQNSDGTTKLDKDGNILIEENADLTLSLPHTYTVGTEVVMFIYKGEEGSDLRALYEANKDNPDRVPIAIQLKEEYGKKAPTVFLHDINWITPSKVVEEDIERVIAETTAIRQHIFKNNQPILNKISSKSMGWINRTTKQRTLREIIGKDDRPVLGFGTRTGSIWNVGSRETINSKFVSGIPYLLLPTANGSYFGAWLGQKEISKTPDMQTKYNNTVVAILESYANRDSIAPKTIKELRDAISSYYHVNTDKLTDEVLRLADKRLIFHVNEREIDKKQVVYLQLKADKGFTRGFQDYRFFNGQWEKHNGKQFVPVADMSKELTDKLADKYANITKQGITAGKNFEVYELVNDVLTKVKKDYIDFLSDNKVVTHSVQSLDVDGTNTYFSQPNIGIDTDITEMKSFETKEKEIKPVEKLQSTEKSINFEDLIKTPISDIISEFSEADMKEAEEVMKHCKGIKI